MRVTRFIPINESPVMSGFVPQNTSRQFGQYLLNTDDGVVVVGISLWEGTNHNNGNICVPRDKDQSEGGISL